VDAHFVFNYTKNIMDFAVLDQSDTALFVDGTTGKVTIEDTLNLNGLLQDNLNNTGTTGDVLTRTTSGVEWSSGARSDSDWIVTSPDMYSGVLGLVGIGTDSPDAKLHIETSSSDGLLVEPSSASEGQTPSIGFRAGESTSHRDITMDALNGILRVRSNPHGGGSGYDLFMVDAVDASLPTDRAIIGFGSAGSIKAGLGITSSTAGHLTFYAGSAVNEVMRVEYTGDVGIGTETPDEKLDVEGNIDVNNNEMKNMRLENRTDDPASPSVGRIWIRTDL
jgi:hypothetical protein